ncbi:MAG: hypothetical protein U0441_12290 [Polyangiaceae bacterium]
MRSFTIASVVSSLAFAAATTACGGGSDTSSGGGGSSSTTSSTSTSDTTSSSTTDSTGGGGSAPTGGFLVAPLVPKDGDATELFRMNADGTDVTQLTKSTGMGMPTDNNDFPAISPDRKTIVFASGRDHAPEVNPMRRAMYAMDAAGGGVHRITNAPTESCIEYPGDVSPDGEWVVFMRSCDMSIDPITANLDKLFRIKLDGTGEEKLAPNDALVTSQSNQDAPAFTPDGKAVLFVSGDPSAELYKLDLATMKITKISKNAEAGRTAAIRRPLVAPSGDVAYVETIASDYSDARMESVKLDGSGSTTLFEIPTDPTTLAFVYDTFALSPAGDQLAFSALGANGETSLVVAGLDGKDPVTIYPSATFVGWGTLSWR